MNFFSDPSERFLWEGSESSMYDSSSPATQCYGDLFVEGQDFQSLETVFRSVDATLGCDFVGEAFCDAYYMAESIVENANCLEYSKNRELFNHLPIEHWNGQDCLNWADFVCKQRQIDASEVCLQNFRSVTGATLLHFTEEHFCNIAGYLHGSAFYEDFLSLCYSYMEEQSYQTPSTTPDVSFDGQPMNLDWSVNCKEELAQQPSFSSGSYGMEDLEMCGEAFQNICQYLPEETAWTPEQRGINSTSTEQQEDDEQFEIDEDVLALCRDYRSSPPEGANNAVNVKIKTKSRKGERGPKIWEFLMRLLADPTTNPELIRWHDSSSDTFVLSQPALIARLWGARANKPNLSSNNFARALRYHYNTGALVAVSERHYMYKCGPKSLQYLNDLRNCPSPPSSFE